MSTNPTQKKTIVFATKTIFFPPLNKKVNILLQHRDGPCLLIAIFNALVLKGHVSIESGIYSPSSIIELVQNFNPHVHGLKKVVRGYYVNPSFYSCNEFKDYPRFLEKLGIRLVHAMIPEKNNKNYELITKFDYDSLMMRMIELDIESGNSKNCADELKALRNWNNRLGRQVTDSGIEAIEQQIAEGEVQIFFRNAHFACIYKHLNHVYSLITCKGLGAVHCAWHSLPNSKGDFTYFDENFIQTVCKPWEENKTAKKSETKNNQKDKLHQQKAAAEAEKAPKKQKAGKSRKDDCTIA
ncbi:hypothetical protein TRFO_07730 [Tritrichomonas foetus]|uniref:MINDY deubiquitinase domain-containing protein n=1 Tax=Tritrichomonas foetus TaxID=1144522 RepID=A0A1J4JTB7_9EUKA|nr:hypothetical protein TRFO_07730 [Tritrichomonas foetus]|eukprot:OHT00766.1 hypothetical protein TRFO_07730 [Tritrichomonas foetus]